MAVGVVWDMTDYVWVAVECESVLMTDNLATSFGDWAELNGNPYGVLTVHVPDPSVTVVVDAVLTLEWCMDCTSDWLWL